MNIHVRRFSFYVKRRRVAASPRRATVSFLSGAILWDSNYVERHNIVYFTTDVYYVSCSWLSVSDVNAMLFSAAIHECYRRLRGSRNRYVTLRYVTS